MLIDRKYIKHCIGFLYFMASVCFGGGVTWGQPKISAPPLIEPMRTVSGDIYGFAEDEDIDVYQEIFGELLKAKIHTIYLLQKKDIDGWSGSPVFLEIASQDNKGFLWDTNEFGMLYPLELRSFIAPEKKEIFFSGIGGNGWDMYYAKVYEMQNDKPQVIFDSNEPWPASGITGQFLDDHKVEFEIPWAKVKILFDVSEQENFYRKRVLSSDDAIEKQRDFPKDAEGAGSLGIMPIDHDGDGIYELRVGIACSGEHTLDYIGDYVFVLKYRDGEWEQIDHWVTPAEGVKLISMTEIEVEECGCGP